MSKINRPGCSSIRYVKDHLEILRRGTLVWQTKRPTGWIAAVQALDGSIPRGTRAGASTAGDRRNLPFLKRDLYAVVRLLKRAENAEKN
jgi:hypothetical protein